LVSPEIQEKEAEEKMNRTRKLLVSSTSYDSAFVQLIYDLQRRLPEKVFHIQGISNQARDINNFSRRFFSKSAGSTIDITVDQNANVSTKTVSQFSAENNKATLRLNGLYLLWKYMKKVQMNDGVKEVYSIVKANNVIERIIDGELFVNDLASVEKPYCWAQSLEMLMFEGAPFMNYNARILPPKRPSSFVNLVVQIVAYLSNQLAGAVALPDLFFYWDYLNRKKFGDKYLTEDVMNEDQRDELKNLFQHIVYSFGTEFRTGQSPFTNVNIADSGFLEYLFGEKTYPDGSKPDLRSVKLLGMRFFEEFTRMNMKEGIFTFPVVTLACSVLDGKLVDEEFVDWVCKVNCEKALGNIYTGDPTSLSSCCRLRNDVNTFTDYQNSFGVSGVSIGSHRVVGINMPRLFVESTPSGIFDKDFFLENLYNRLDDCKLILEAHRKIIEKHIEVGVLPLYTHGWMFLEKQYSTIGIIGVYEMQSAYNSLHGYEDVSKNIKNYSFAIDVVSRISKKTQEWSSQGTSKYNLEQIPGESLAVRLAEVDDIMGKSRGEKIYSNQYVPLVVGNVTISDRFKIQGKFDTLTSGGSILHINIDESEHITPDQMKKLFEIAVKTGTVYWALNYVYAKCYNGHYFLATNKETKCPACGSEDIKFFSRVVGFITPVASWIDTRRNWEFGERKFYSGKII